ncbi:hypothetical protein [Roseicyclus mahoneyensis]|uniref:Uncharacterized protein n=1 Tax=Roseicyclus mahoneyensis TaxID=164332 RepID=A0A316GAX2_9RHOB|nr:hypothetical protein [Roseicyclus mahoneyensis]PWK58061.1 hypothetical protein C7455_1101 [Roseicyclus mahoneyensis]
MDHITDLTCQRGESDLDAFLAVTRGPPVQTLVLAGHGRVENGASA